jgi:hypothetical protein
VYYNRNEETGELETITKEIASNIEFVLDEGEIESIKYLKKSDGKTYPPSMLPEEVRRLNGFVWRGLEQPKSKYDIFIKDRASKKEEPVIPKPKIPKGKALEVDKGGLPKPLLKKPKQKNGIKK